MPDIEGVVLKTDIPLADFTTFRIGGTAALWLEPTDIPGLEKALAILHSNFPAFRILGNGSNLLVDDRGVDAVLSLNGLTDLGFGNGMLEAGAGVRLSRLITFCHSHDLGGLEPLCGIPASVGGAVKMNAGANGLNFLDFVESVLIVTPNGSQWFKCVDMESGYRDGGIPKGAVVAGCRIRVAEEDAAYLSGRALYRVRRKRSQEILKRVMAQRILSQPLGQPSAGCIFRNPENDSAGRLIDQAGLKGRRAGSAEISMKHANFIVNLGGASFYNVMELIDCARERVKAMFGICLEPEVTIWKEASA